VLDDLDRRRAAGAPADVEDRLPPELAEQAVAVSRRMPSPVVATTGGIACDNTSAPALNRRLASVQVNLIAVGGGRRDDLWRRRRRQPVVRGCS